MFEESLIKSNFIGKDGYRWWIGQIPRDEVNQDGNGWGNRSKVRIYGYHPFDETLKDEDLPWAIVKLPTTAGSGARGRAENIKLAQGDIVLGFFADGDNGQIPIIDGVLGRTEFVSTDEFKAPFVPFTGYTDKIEAKDAYIPKNESNEQNSRSQKAPRAVSRTKASQIGSDERPASSAYGLKINLATKKPKSTLEKITTEIENFIHKIQEIKNGISEGIGTIKQKIDKKIADITKSIKKHASGLVGSMTKGLYKKLGPTIKKGLVTLYKSVKAVVLAATGNEVIAHEAGVAAQRALYVPIKLVKNAIPCVVNNVIGLLSSGIKDMLSNIADNVTNFASCIADQVIGGISNIIIGGMTKFLGPIIGGITKILGVFDFISFLRSNVAGLLGIIGALSCNEEEEDTEDIASDYYVGAGTKGAAEKAIEGILDLANSADNAAKELIDTAQEISQLTGSLGVWDFNNPSVSIPGFLSSLGSCYTGPPLNCITGVTIFGGGGVGGAAKAIFGSLVGDEGRTTASIIGINLTNGGSGYIDNPMISIDDNCGQGYGASARAIVDYDESSPTYGQIVDIYVVCEGEGYPVDDTVNDEYVIDEIVVLSPGTGYESNDICISIVDNDTEEREEHQIVIDDNGSVSKVLPINNDNRIVKDLPRIRIKSKTGYGAVLSAKLKVLDRDKQISEGQLTQVIDCIN